MSRLLLDTQAALWWDAASPSLGAQARAAIQDAEAVFVSAASEWELAIKAALGRIELRRSMLDAATDAGFEPLTVSFRHAQAVRGLKPLHRDPFDRLLVAVARVEGLSLVTSDTFLADYAIVVIDAAR